VVTRVLPLLDMARNRAQSAGGTSEEMREAMEGLLVSHRDVRTTLQSQTTELKRVEDEVVKLRESMDKTAFEQTTAADDMKSMQRLVKHASMYIGIVLGLLVAAVGYMAFLVFSYLNHPAH
jgi:ABC-type multidrug transport system fused ATPase/permease subunit